METVLFHVSIQDPPTKYVITYKKPKVVGDKFVDKISYYLTANLFYSQQLHFATRNKIMNYAKDWIFWYLKEIPVMDKCRIEITYWYPNDTFDLDNKVYFWAKVILDLLKTPSDKQVLNGEKHKNPVKSLRVLKDDTVRYVDGIDMKYKLGRPSLEIKITGRLSEIQGQLF